MDFGRVENPNRVRFDLPPDQSRSIQVLNRYRDLKVSQSNPVHEKVRVYFGAPIWNCPDWKGTVYPLKVRSTDHLKYYSQQFNSIELNSTFYGLPSIETIESWRKECNSAFRFAPKLPRSISHEASFKPVERLKSEVSQFFETVDRLGENLGISFLQLGPGFCPREISVLDSVLSAVPKRRKLAVEFRHPGWFVDHGLCHEVLGLLESRGIATVITDTGGERQVVHSSLTVPAVMIRFLGNEGHPSNFSRLDDWVERISLWAENGLREVWFFFHLPEFGNVPVLSNYFAKAMNSKLGLDLKRCLPEHVIDENLSEQLDLQLG